EADNTCLICLDPVEHRPSYGTIMCPACKHAWFHRSCIQGHAVCAGIFCFVCPLCRDREGFQTEMFMMGIRVPARLPLREGRHTYPAMNQRHSRCDASECVCPGGREQAENEG
ncbi:G2E3 ligase, partial [Atlantisia rogersi]|nr:G2E3 ligase [Atlantisia rogersi]NXV81513.1 G2E3 ligase [Atlantisia rogersi]